MERGIHFLQVPKGNIVPGFKDRMVHYEEQIIRFINPNRPRNKPISQLQQGQHPPSHDMDCMQQPQSQINLVQSHDENQMNPHLQSMNGQSSAGTMS